MVYCILSLKIMPSRRFSSSAAVAATRISISSVRVGTTAIIMRRESRTLVGMLPIRTAIGTRRWFCEELHHSRVINMPAIMTGKMGRVDKWLKKEGDVFRGTEALCEVTVSQDGVFDNFSDVQVAVDAHQPGVLSKILVQNGEIVAVDQPIAIFVDDLREYMDLVEASRIATAEAELIAEMKSDTDDATIKSNSKILMREIRHLMKKGDIDHDSEFAKELQYLARKSNPDLLSIFEASFDGQHFNEETFDVKFFVENAEEIVKESIEAKQNAS